MKKNRFITSLILVIAILSFCAVSFAAEMKAPTSAAPKAGTTSPVSKAGMTSPVPPKPNFGMIAGTVTSVNNVDPANVKLTVKNDADGTVHILSITPWTNITKVTDVSELKEGEQVRIMSSKNTAIFSLGSHDCRRPFFPAISSENTASLKKFNAPFNDFSRKVIFSFLKILN